MSSDILNTEFTPEEAEETRRTLVDLRRRIANNEAVPPAELSAGLLKLRRMYGSEANIAVKAKKPAKAKAKPKVDADDLLNGILGGL